MKRDFLKRIIAMSIMVSTVLMPISANAEWKQDSNGWWNTEGGSWSVGWRNINNNWYYFNPSTGYMQTGWINDNGTWYFASQDGAMKTGWINDNGTWYFTNQDGTMQTGTVEVDGNIYCLANNGAMLKGNVMIDGKVYTFDESGKNISNEEPKVGKVFTKDESGSIKESTNNVNGDTSNSTSNTDNTSSSTSSSSSGSSSSSSSSSSKPKTTKIDKIETVTNGVIKVYLNNATSKTLDKEAFAISCPGFNDMTIFSVETPTGKDKNKVYTLKTAYYDDKIYTLHITLPSGKTIDKDFESKYDCPLITNQKVRRLSDDVADLSYISDAEGIFYYVLTEDKPSRSFFSSNANLTVNDILDLGSQSKMKVGSNKVDISNLEKGRSYTIQYVAQDVEGKVTPIKTETISSEVISDSQSSEIQIEDIKPNKEIIPGDVFASKYWFTFELNKATDKPLNIENFVVTCPKGTLTLGNVETKDNKTYNVYMKSGHIPFDKTSFTGRITFEDGTTAEKDFYVDLSAPTTLRKSISRTTEDAVQLELRFDEGGTIYYSILDHVSEDTSVKDPSDIYENGTKEDISYGTNIINIEDKDIADGKYIAWATEDEYKNRSLYFEYIKIPEYKEEENKPEEEKLKIIDAEANIDDEGYPYVQFRLNKVVNIFSDITSKEITNLSGKATFDFVDPINGAMDSDIIRMTIMNGVKINKGKHQIILTMKNGERIVYEFETTEEIG